VLEASDLSTAPSPRDPRPSQRSSNVLRLVIGAILPSSRAGTTRGHELCTRHRDEALRTH